MTTRILRTNVPAGRVSRRSALLVAAVGLFMASLAVPALALECEVGQRAFTHAGGETCIPEDPQRIVSLHDQSVTLTLLEVGAPVVGSHGRVDEEGARFAFPQGIGATYAKTQGWDGILNVYAGYGGLTKVLQDLGFERVPFAQEMVERGVAWGEEVSAEVLPELQADYIFDTYTIAYGDTLASPAERMAEVLPSWCDLLMACSEGRYIVVAREYATGFSFAQLNMVIQLIVTHAARSLAQPGA
ncbi:hypothetical protein [Devosia sp. RR2S18]|uniref:hypothetical protein n=1 Tax=Devosia rhizosphaerae TaxID=3049774 RepID=UPI00254126D8|nr:hypothetical protein [Devosia sp. RR2S18]WIJ24951.1 hypothetical protein QOV41_18380 [Devosia sp. RR2S18]